MYGTSKPERTRKKYAETLRENIHTYKKLYVVPAISSSFPTLPVPVS